MKKKNWKLVFALFSWVPKVCFLDYRQESKSNRSWIFYRQRKLICTVGFEPNLLHQTSLEDLQESYQNCGWRVRSFFCVFVFVCLSLCVCLRVSLCVCLLSLSLCVFLCVLASIILFLFVSDWHKDTGCDHDGGWSWCWRKNPPIRPQVC